MTTKNGTMDNFDGVGSRSMGDLVQQAQMADQMKSSMSSEASCHSAKEKTYARDAQSQQTQSVSVAVSVNESVTTSSIAPTASVGTNTSTRTGAVACDSTTSIHTQTPGGKTVTMGISEIKVCNPRRTVKNVETLCQSIEEHGLLHPITVNSDGHLIAGMRRLEACRTLGFTSLAVTVVECDKIRAELLQIDENLIRNELSVLERAEQLARRKEIYEQIYPDTKAGVAGGRARHGSGGEQPSFAADTAEKVGCSERSVQMDDQIGRIPQTARDALRNTSVAHSKTDLLKLARLKTEEEQLKYATLFQSKQAHTFEEAKALLLTADVAQQRKDIAAGTLKLPEGVFEIISMDVPWPYDDMDVEKGNGWGKNHLPYPTMTLEQIANLEVPAAQDCILFFWTTHRYLKDSFRLLEGWGFRDVSIITWVKGKDEKSITPSLGVWLRTQSEYCIMAVKGKPKRFTQLTNQGTVLFGPRREHSRKPDEFYEMVESLCCYSTGRKLDYFSREPRPGWERFGNDADKFAEASQVIEQAQDKGGDANFCATRLLR